MLVANPTIDVIELLKRGERRAAAELLAQFLVDGPPNGDHWRSVGKLAGHMGEIDMALDAARRYAGTAPPTLERQLHLAGELAVYGLADEALALVRSLPGGVRSHPAVLHIEGTLLAERGDSAAALPLFREAIAQSDVYSQSWFAFAATKTFVRDDPDLKALENATPLALKGSPNVASQHFYALGKAYQDVGRDDLAFESFERGAALRRTEERYDRAAMETRARRTIAEFSSNAFASLKRSGARGQPAIFVNGLPRSGSTLVEQILTSHSAVADGGEVNLVRAALMPTIDFSMEGAKAMEARAPTTNPWTMIAEDYRRMIAMRFRTDLQVVDKTLNQSFLMGLLLHALPDARIIWMRRQPADNALSCYTTNFSTPVPWSWSLEDIGHFFSLDNMLFEHWQVLFSERILVVPYEELTADPQLWVGRILSHVDLPFEESVLRFHESKRAVRTASTGQIRSPISTARVGSADRYATYMIPFFENYRIS